MDSRRGCGWSFSPNDSVAVGFTMRTERGVAFRPPINGSLVLGPASASPPVYMPGTDAEWMVERGPGGGGRLGSHEG